MFLKWKVIVLISLVLQSVSCKNQVNNNSEIVVNASDTSVNKKISSPVLIYGIPSDSFKIISGHIKPNSLLSEILLKHGVSTHDIDQAIKKSKTVFDVRTIRSGNNYVLFCNKDSIARARYFVYEHDPTTSYVFSFNDSLNITRFSKETKSETGTGVARRPHRPYPHRPRRSVPAPDRFRHQPRIGGTRR